jgi:hypothetical protein
MVNNENKEEIPRKPNGSRQTFFAIALLALWLLIYLAVHYHILKN